MDGAKMIGVIFGALLQIQRTRLKLTASALVGQQNITAFRVKHLKTATTIGFPFPGVLL